MCYALIQKTDGIPFVISENDQYFGDYINRLDYNVVDRGTKKTMLDLEKEKLEELYYEMQFD